MNRGEAIAWAAGLFEGEGCIYLGDKAPNQARRQRFLIVNMTDRDVLERFHRIVGVGRLRELKPNRTTKPHYKPLYEWRVARWEHIAAVLAMFDPYFGERRGAKAAEMLADPARDPNAPRKTHCVRGHPLDGPGADVYINPAEPMHRQCRRCTRERRRELRSA